MAINSNNPLHKTLVLGIGNTILGDDGAGVRVVRRVSEKYTGNDVCFRETSAAGLNLLDIIPGFERLIVVDAVLTDNAHIGRVFCLKASPADKSGAVSLHSCALDAALQLSSRLDPSRTPREVKVIALGIKAVESVTEELSPKVEAALEKATEMVMNELDHSPSIIKR